MVGGWGYNPPRIPPEIQSALVHNFCSKIEGLNIPVYIPMTASKGMDTLSRAMQRHSTLPWQNNIEFDYSSAAISVGGGCESLALTLLARQAFQKVIGITVDHR